MVSTRLASPGDPMGPPCTDRRDRVDPVKLLALIARIKSAGGGGGAGSQAPDTRRQPSARVG